MNNNRHYTAAVIGTGRIGYLLQKDKKREQPASHSRALHMNKRIHIIAGCDNNHDRINAWHKDYPRATPYTDHTQLLSHESPDIIVIAVDEKAHYQIAEDVIKHHPKLIILEKPVAPNITQASKIIELSKEHNVAIQINHERRFSKDYITLKKLLKQNIIGTIHSIHAGLFSSLKVWHENGSVMGDCSLIHDGTHLVDIIHFLFDCKLGEPVIDNIITAEHTDAVFLHFITDNTIIYLEINGQKKYFGFELEIRGSHGKILIGNGYFHVYKREPSPYYSNFYSLKKNKKIYRPRKTGYFSGMLNNCIDYLDGTAELQSPVDEGYKTLTVLYRIAEKL